METHEYIVDQVHKYLTGQMNSQELSEFEQRLVTDTRYAEELKLQKGINVITQVYRQMELRAELNDIAERVKNTPPVNHSSTLYKAILVTVSILLLAGIWFFLQSRDSAKETNRKIMAQKRFDEHMTSFDLEGIYLPGPLRSESDANTRSATEHFSNELSKGMEYYMSGDYAKAIEQMEQLREEGESQDWTNFLLGVSYLQIGEANAAIMHLKRIENDGLEGEKNWYLAMANLKLGKFLLAQKQFEAAIGTELLNGEKKRSAREILIHLKEK